MSNDNDVETRAVKRGYKTKPKTIYREALHTRFSDELAEELCARVALDHRTLQEVYAENPDKYPASSTVHNWLVNPNPKYDRLRAMYSAATIVYWNIEAERFNAVTNTLVGMGPDDATVDLEELPHMNLTQINQVKSWVDSKKWLLCKMLPKIFGDKLTVDAPQGISWTINAPEPKRINGD